MAVNSHHFACSCINQQTLNHPSVSRYTDVREKPMKPVQFSSHSEAETISVPVYSHLSVFPHPRTEISPKCPEKKRKKETEFILPGKLFLGIASEKEQVCTFVVVVVQYFFHRGQKLPKWHNQIDQVADCISPTLQTCLHISVTQFTNPQNDFSPPLYVTSAFGSFFKYFCLVK